MRLSEPATAALLLCIGAAPPASAGAELFPNAAAWLPGTGMLRDAVATGANALQSGGLGWVLLLTGCLVALLVGGAWWLHGYWPISALFAPAGVTVVHNPLVRQPLVIHSETIDLEQIAQVDAAIAAVAADLGYGMGIKGGIARKMLKILHGTPEPAAEDFDVDYVLIAEAGLTPAEETELRKTVSGMKLGHLILEPKDVEVISKEGMKTYWVHRDICLNEVLLLRLAPGAPLTLFYSGGALEDAAQDVIRSIPHALRSDFTECWILDGAQPILSPKHVARTLVRYFKGGGSSYELGEDTWAYYRRNKLGPITLFQILRPVHSNDERYQAVVSHLIDVGLLSSSAVRTSGGFNGLWGATLKEVNDRMAQFGGRLGLDELDADAVERWIVGKKLLMRSLPYRQRDAASRTGYIPADEDSLSLGLVTFPDVFLDYVESEGGLYDPQHPEGAPAEAARAAARAAAAPAPPRGPPQAAVQGGQGRQGGPAPLPEPWAARAAGGASEGDLEAGSNGSQPGSTAGGRPTAGWLGWLAGALGGLLGGGHGAQGAGGLQEPLLPAGGTAAAADVAPVARAAAAAAGPLRYAVSAEWQGAGEDGEVQYIPAQTMMGSAPAVGPDEGRLGMAWMAEQEAAQASDTMDGRAKDDPDCTPGVAPPSQASRPASRYTSVETLHFICRVALAAWPLLLVSSALMVASVGLHLYQLRVQSVILNLATTGETAGFLTHISLLARLCLAYVAINWLSNVVLQAYLRRAMMQLYTGLFNHVVFQDCVFYDSISASELAMRCGVDMMNIRVLVGFLAQKMIKGLTQVIAGVALLAAFAGPALGARFNALLGTAVLLSLGELVVVSLLIRGQHRVARSALGRLYGFSYDVFSSIHAVIAMALQRTFSDSYAALADSYFRAAMTLAVYVASHQFVLEAVFSAGVTVCLMYIGGSSLLSGTVSVGTVYALLRYTAVVEQGYTALSEGVARFFASYGSLEHVIDLHQRGQLTHRGKPAVLEYLEREDAARRRDVAAGGGAAGSAAVGGPAGEDGGWANWSRRLTADVWAGGVRCRDVIYNYKGRSSNILFALSLDVPAGGAVLVSGAPNSGRSTLLHLLHLDITAGGGSVQFLTTSGAWLAYHPTSTDKYAMQERMGFVSPQSCIEAVFYASLQENMVCACQRRLPSVADCQEAAALTRLAADVAQMPDSYQTLVGEASRVELGPMARLRLGIARLLLLDNPRLVLIDDADRFLTAVPRLPEVVARLRAGGAAVVLTSNAGSEAGLRAALPSDVRPLLLEGGRLRPV